MKKLIVWSIMLGTGQLYAAFKSEITDSSRFKIWPAHYKINKYCYQPLQTDLKSQWHPYAHVNFPKEDILEIDLYHFFTQDLPYLERIIVENGISKSLQILEFNYKNIMRTLATITSEKIVLKEIFSKDMMEDYIKISNSQTWNMIDGFLEPSFMKSTQLNGQPSYFQQVISSFFDHYPLITKITYKKPVEKVIINDDNNMKILKDMLLLKGVEIVF